MELSFCNELQIQTLVEQLIQYIFKETLNVDIKIPFIRMNYIDAVNTYGSDKPDLRFDLKLIDATDYFKNTTLDLFKQAKAKNEVIKAIVVDQVLDKKIINELEKYAKDMKAKGLAYIIYDGTGLKGQLVII